MDDPLIPHLKVVHQFPTCFKRIGIDRGAIRFVLSGATLMAPGLTSTGGKLPEAEEECKEGEVVVVEAEGKEEVCFMEPLLPLYVLSLLKQYKTRIKLLTQQIWIFEIPPYNLKGYNADRIRCLGVLGWSITNGNRKDKARKERCRYRCWAFPGRRIMENANRLRTVCAFESAFRSGRLLCSFLTLLDMRLRSLFASVCGYIRGNTTG